MAVRIFRLQYHSFGHHYLRILTLAVGQKSKVDTKFEANDPKSFCMAILICTFVVQLLLSMHTTFYSAGSVVASAGEIADRLMIIVSGRVKVRPSSRRTPLIENE
jgi:CRP-like cAMP-binding protein